MKKILVGIFDSNIGGINRFLTDFVSYTNKLGIKPDVISSGEIADIYQDEFDKLGIKVFIIPSLNKPFQQYKAVSSILNVGKYDVVYINISLAVNCVVLLAAWKLGVPKRFVHSHSSGVDEQNFFKRTFFKVFHYVFRIGLRKLTTSRLACSVKAASWMFGISKGTTIVFNAIDTKKFAFNPVCRTSLRNTMKLENNILVGYVGSFSYQKNVFFLARIFRQLYKQDSRCRFLVIGDGKLREKFEILITKWGLEKVVFFTGNISNVAEYMSAMDVFLLPSKFEGLPIVGVEAQVSGLPCFFSRNITDEIKISPDCFFLPLKKSANYWASFILKNISLVRAALPQEYWIEKLDLNRGNGPARQVLSLIQREL